VLFGEDVVVEDVHKLREGLFVPSAAACEHPPSLPACACACESARLRACAKLRACVRVCVRSCLHRDLVATKELKVEVRYEETSARLRAHTGYSEHLRTWG
jgi:hypothetical protein